MYKSSPVTHPYVWHDSFIRLVLITDLPWSALSNVLQCVAVCCSVLQCVAVCCSLLQSVAVCCSLLQCIAVCRSVLQWVAVLCSVLHCVALCCSVLQCVAVCCNGPNHGSSLLSVLQWDQDYIRNPDVGNLAIHRYIEIYSLQRLRAPPWVVVSTICHNMYITHRGARIRSYLNIAIHGYIMPYSNIFAWANMNV